MENRLIPFGKYKGQPIEVLAQDKPYLEWLQTQDWFKQRYGNINTIIVNNFGAPAETPEHNKIQAMFTEKAFANSFLQYIMKDHIEAMKKERYCLRFDTVSMIRFKETKKVAAFGSFDKKTTLDKIRAHYQPDSKTTYETIEELFEVPVTRLFLSFPDRLRVECSGISFESKGIDVVLSYCINPHDPSFHTSAALTTIPVEIKPNLSDDYPAVLRQMMANTSQYLLIGSYDGVGATLEQVRFIFKASHRTIVLLSQINS